MSPGEREALFARYESGPGRLRKAWEAVPYEARLWRPAPGKWSAHEVVVHCADSETNAAMRIRLLAGERDPVIPGYDQDGWARDFDYHALPVELSLDQIESVRAWTAVFIRRLPPSAWTRAGRHTEYAEPYTAEQWLRIYAEHLEVHERQLVRNVAAWRARTG